jgi:hypothetical protein
VALIDGKMIIRITIIPIPPIQCVKLLQNKIEYGSISTFFRIDEPVVDNPEVDSKNASVKEGIVPLIRYGKVPRSEKMTQERVTARNPSLFVNFFESASREIK